MPSPLHTPLETAAEKDGMTKLQLFHDASSPANSEGFPSTRMSTIEAVSRVVILWFAACSALPAWCTARSNCSSRSSDVAIGTRFQCSVSLKMALVHTKHPMARRMWLCLFFETENTFCPFPRVSARRVDLVSKSFLARKTSVLNYTLRWTFFPEFSRGERFLLRIAHALQPGCLEN